MSNHAYSPFGENRFRDFKRMELRVGLQIGDPALLNVEVATPPVRSSAARWRTLPSLPMVQRAMPEPVSNPDPVWDNEDMGNAASPHPTRRHLNNVENIKDKARFFFDHYGLTEHDLERYLSAALSAGGDYADLYFEYLSSTSLMVDESMVKSASQGISV